MVRTQCAPIEQVMYRDFVIVNEDKVKYCYGIHDSFIDMDLKLFISFLPAVRASLFKITSLKGTLYCSMCDAHKQQFFSPVSKEIMMSQNFCRRLLEEERDYFMFMHVVYIELLDNLLQYLACFETDARVFSFPFPSFMAKYRRRIKYVKSCLSSLGDKKNFFKNCFMICRKFSLTRFSPFYEGDLELFRRVNVALHSFLRKLARAKKDQSDADLESLKKFGVTTGTDKVFEHAITVPENVDGEMLEPFGAHLGLTDKNHYLEDKEMLMVYGDVDTNKYSLMVDQNDPEAVKEYKQLKKQKEQDELDALTEKLAREQKMLDDMRAGKWVPPEKKEFKLPPDQPYVGMSGLIDRLSQRKFKEHLHEGHYPQRGKHKFTLEDWKFTKLKHHYGALIKEKFDNEKAREKARKEKEAKELKAKLEAQAAIDRQKKADEEKREAEKKAEADKKNTKTQTKEANKKSTKKDEDDNTDIITDKDDKKSSTKTRILSQTSHHSGGSSTQSSSHSSSGSHNSSGSKSSSSSKNSHSGQSSNSSKSHSTAKKENEKKDEKNKDSKSNKKGTDTVSKDEKEKVKHKKQSKKKKKSPYAVLDKLSSKVIHKEYRDVISNPNKHVTPGRPKPEKLPEVQHVEPLSAIFEKSEAATDIQNFIHEFVKEGLDPLFELDHVNFRFNVTTLIERRYRLPERLDRRALGQYLLLNKKRMKEFNEDIDMVEIKDFDTIDEKLRDVKELRKKLEVMLKTPTKPEEKLKIVELQSEIKKMEKAVLENEAKDKMLRKHTLRQMKKREKGDSDLNKNRYPDYHHHKDLYFDDSFAGINKHFEEIFGS